MVTWLLTEYRARSCIIPIPADTILCGLYHAFYRTKRALAYALLRMADWCMLN